MKKVKSGTFDLDLRFGLEGENEIKDLLRLKTIEVKSDRMWQVTGNLYIETKCWYNSHQKWLASGLTKSTATHWAFRFAEGFALIIPTLNLRKAVDKYGKPISCQYEENPSKGFLIRPSEIFEYMSGGTSKPSTKKGKDDLTELQRIIKLL